MGLGVTCIVEIAVQLQVTSDPDSSANYSDQLELQTDSQHACLNSQLGFSSFAKLQKQHTEHHVEQTSGYLYNQNQNEHHCTVPVRGRLPSFPHQRPLLHSAKSVVGTNRRSGPCSPTSSLRPLDLKFTATTSHNR
jgi:hypothetical protein